MKKPLDGIMMELDSQLSTGKNFALTCFRIILKAHQAFNTQVFQGNCVDGILEDLAAAWTHVFIRIL